MSNPKFAFLNDEIVPWDDAKVHISTGGFKFGAGVFEGIRGYWNDAAQQMYVFQLQEHMHRLTFSQKFMRFDEIVDVGYIGEKVLELLRANEYRENVHIMTTVFVNGFGGPATSGPVGLAITAAPRTDIPWSKRGCKVQVSSWQRVPDAAMPVRVKCNANYQNGRLAALQARADGYDSALLLNTRGKISEGPAMCFFMLRDGRAITPSITNDILESITRRTVLDLFREYCDIETEERDVDRSELAAADEAFFCGTAWEITPIVSIDRLPVGNGEVGPATNKLQQAFFRIAEGRTDDHPEWRTPVYPG